MSFYKGLLHNNLKVVFLITPKAQHRQCGLGEIGIMQRYTVKSKCRFHEIIQTYCFYQCCSMVIDHSFTPFCNSFAKYMR